MPTSTAPADYSVWTDPEPVAFVAPRRLGEDPGVWAFYLRDPRTLATLSDLTLSDELDEDDEPIGRSDIVIDQWRERLAEDGSVSWTISANNPDMGLIERWKVELHGERNGVLHLAGPIVSRSAETASGEVSVQSFTLDGWLKVRTHFVPGADPYFNWFEPNHDFEFGISRWGGPVDSFDTGDVESGAGSAVLTDTGHQLRRVVTLDSTDYNYTAQIRFRVKVTDDVPTYEALRVDCPNTAPGGAAITDSTARNVWTWIECEIPVDGLWDRNNQFTCVFAGPSAGTVKVDRAIFTMANADQIFADEFGVDFPDPPITVMDSAQIGVLAVQPLADLNIGSRSTNTGITLATPAPGPQIIYDTLRNGAGLGALEWRWELTQQSRTLVLAHRVGGLIDEVTIDASLIEGFRADEDATALANVVHAVDSDGNFGTSVDLDALDGVKVERIVSAPSGVTGQDGLDGFAEWSRRDDAPDVTTHVARGLPGSWLDLIQLGDRLAVTAEWGFVDLDATVMRVVGRTVYPHDDLWDAELNEYDPDA